MPSGGDRSNPGYTTLYFRRNSYQLPSISEGRTNMWDTIVAVAFDMWNTVVAVAFDVYPHVSTMWSFLLREHQPTLDGIK